MASLDLEQPLQQQQQQAPASSTPTRPPRLQRSSSSASNNLQDTPNAGFNSESRSPNLRKVPPFRHRTSLQPSADDADQTPRKVQPLPTPPTSESTSSASGSVGRASSRLSQARSANFDNLLSLPDGPTPGIARSRSSASSSRSAGETIGARSPVENQAGFRSNSSMNTDSSTLEPEPRYSTLGRRHASNLTGVALDSPRQRSNDSASSSRASLLRQGSDATRTASQRELRAVTPLRGEEGDDFLARDRLQRSEGRRRRSEMHEHEVSQIRSESRLGWMEAGIDEQATLRSDSYLRSKYSPKKATTPARRSGSSLVYSTEMAVGGEDGDGVFSSGSVRRRKKSSAESSVHSSGRGSHASSTRAADDSHARSSYTGSVRGGGAGYDYIASRRTASPQLTLDEAGGPVGSISRVGGKRIGSPLNDSLPLDGLAANRSSSARNPMPLEFRLPDKETRRAYRAGAGNRERRSSLKSETDSVSEVEELEEGEEAGRDSPPLSSAPTLSEVRPSEDQSLRTPSMGSGGFPTPSSSSRSSSNRQYSSGTRRRYTSDARSDDLPKFDYDGRGGTQGSRLSVDSSSANRYLAQGTGHVQAATPLSLRTSSRTSFAHPDVASPSEEARARKISSSSSVSQRSSGAASDLHRSASRASMRRALGRDVFDDEGLPSLPGRVDSPSVRGVEQRSLSERLRMLKERQKELKEGSAGRSVWQHELDELRHRIDELTVAGSQASEGSRSPSVQSIRAHSVAAGTKTFTPNPRPLPRSPATEPIKNRHERALTLSEIDPYEASDRASSHDLDLPRSTRSFSSRATKSSSVNAQRSYTSIGHHVTATSRAPMTPDISTAHRLAAASRASVIQSATLPAVARFPSGSVATGTNRIRSEGAAETAPVHDRNMWNALDMFDRYFAGNGSAMATGTSTPSTPGSGPESVELVAKFKQVTSSASKINAGLRLLVQTAVEAQIDAELEDQNRGGGGKAVDAFRQLDAGLTQLLKFSDDQLRNLTDGLIAFTRAERERDRHRKISAESVVTMSGGGFGGSGSGRPSSRMSTTAFASPAVDDVSSTRRSIDTRRSSFDLRRSASREPGSPAGTVIDHGVGSSGGTNGVGGHSKASVRINERFLHLNRAPPSPFSPLQAKGSNSHAAGGDRLQMASPSPLTGSQAIPGGGGVGDHVEDRVATKNVASVDVGPTRTTTSASTIGFHSRSSSEMSPNALLRRQRSTVHGSAASLANHHVNAVVQASSASVKPPSSLSPRRPKISFPTVSNATAAASHRAEVGSSEEGGGMMIEPIRKVESPSSSPHRKVAFPTKSGDRRGAEEVQVHSGWQEPSSSSSLLRSSHFVSEPLGLDLALKAGNPTSTKTRRNTVATSKVEQPILDDEIPTPPPETDPTSLPKPPPPRPPRHDLIKSGASRSEDDLDADEEEDKKSLTKRISKGFLKGVVGTLIGANETSQPPSSSSLPPV